eukprot:TRINITY_DN12985_c0_g2_i1.p1 TRINITY_DN12985_c0_g2~~TRINITY_DN12985_c0_g2_i1.p1  ORF type:complete len:173 (-),score=46.62 TRINITY_DN12985_c0_g2_i1:36-554(-)
MNADTLMENLTALLGKNNQASNNLLTPLNETNPQDNRTSDSNKKEHEFTELKTPSDTKEYSSRGRLSTQLSQGSLANASSDERQRRQMLKLDKELKEALEYTNCTFQPRINSNKTLPRYLQPSKQPLQSKPDPECTFKPSVNTPKNAKKLHEYLSKDPYERLGKQSKPPSGQ